MASSSKREAQQRRRFGVVAYLEKKNEKIEVRLDDLELVDDDSPEWRHWAYFTSSFFDEEALLSHQLTEEQYAAIGKAVASRLAALRTLE